MSEEEIAETLKQEGFTFIKWVDVKRGGNRIFKMSCPYGHITEKSVGNFNQGKRCQVCSYLYLSFLKTPDVSYYQKLLSDNVKYKEHMSITGLLPDRKLNFHCTLCKSDEIGLAGLCDGTFKMNRSSVKQGCIPCRCNKSHILTLEQNTYLLSNRLKETGKQFVCWDGVYKNDRTKFNLVCEKGTPHTMSYTCFKTNGYRCKCCGERKEGFDYNSKATLYAYEVSYEGRFGCKVGISNCLHKRFSNQKGTNKHCKYKLLYKWEFKTGREAFDIEQEVKNNFYNKFFSKKEMPDGYTESYDIKDLPEILNHITSTLQ